MKVMILAAGSGSRLQPLSLLSPKPLTRLVTTPVMETQIRHLAAAGVREIVVNTSYLSDQIEAYFGDGSAWGVDISYSYEGHIENGQLTGTPLGSGGGIRRIHDHSQFFDEPFLVLCGDAFINFDVARVSDFHQESKALATIVTQRVSPAAVEKYGVVMTTSAGKVISFQEKPTLEEAKSFEANTGVYLFSPEIVDQLPVDQVYDIGSELFPSLIEKGLPLYAQNQRFDWLDIGSPADLFAANAHLLTVPTNGFSLPGKEIRAGLWVGGNCAIDPDSISTKGTVVIEGGCRIEPGVTLIGPCVIGRACILESNSRVQESYLGPNLRLRRGGVLERRIVLGEYAVSPEGDSCYWPSTMTQLRDARSADGSVVFDEQAIASVSPITERA